MYLWTFFDDVRNSIDLSATRKLADLKSFQQQKYHALIQNDWTNMIERVNIFGKEIKFNLVNQKVPRLTKKEMEDHFRQKETVISMLTNKIMLINKEKYVPHILKEIQNNIDNIYYNGIVVKEQLLFLNKTCFFLPWIEDDVIFKNCNQETSFGKLIVVNSFIDRQSIESIL